MKLKNLTKKEKILLIIIALVIIALIVFVFIKIFSNDSLKGVEVESLLKENLELYNKNNEEYIWCLEDSKEEVCLSSGISIVAVDNLFKINPNIDFGECLLKSEDSLVIEKHEDGSYTYKASIVCSKDFKNIKRETSLDNVLSDDLQNNENIYYETPASE